MITIEIPECVRCAHFEANRMFEELRRFLPKRPWAGMSEMPDVVQYSSTEIDEGTVFTVLLRWFERKVYEGSRAARIVLSLKDRKPSEVIFWYYSDQYPMGTEHVLTEEGIKVLCNASFYRRRNEESHGRHALALATWEHDGRQLFSAAIPQST